ncbi:MAG TPA: FtsX-like permease family protein [Acidimicrobiia bacterium]|nr:FtsX-like permease family protein [Acidimicrobiia bacterium]
MLRATLKSALGHRLRLVLTAMSVMMGVAFVAGTFIFTDTIDKTFDELFADVYAGQDVIVQSETGYDVSLGIPPPFNAGVIETVRGVPGVVAAEGSVSGFAVIYDEAGKAIVPTGPPTLGGSWVEDDRLVGNTEMREGRGPTASDEVVIDARTATAHDLVLGDVVEVQTLMKVATYRVVGIIGFGEADNLGGATMALFDLDTAQRLFGMEGEYSSITVVADSGTTPEVLTRRIQAVLPDTLEAVTATDELAAQTQSMQESLGFLQTALLVFAAVAVFVGSFIIQNTFRIIVRQRQRELGLMRAVGATGSQIIWMVVIEALLVGLVASLLGILLGFGIAGGLTVIMDAAGFSMPSTSAPLALRTIVVGLAVGLLVTVAAAVVPAVRASRIPPVAALHDMDVTLRMSDRARAIIGGILLAAGVGFMVSGLLEGLIDIGPLNQLTRVGIGAALVFLAVSLLSSNVVKPAAAVLGHRSVLTAVGVLSGLALVGTGVGLVVYGASSGVGAVAYMIPLALIPLAVGGLALYLGLTVVRDRFSPALAVQNAVRKPRRTATTASALMIGLALVTFCFILGDSIKASAGQAIDEGLRADYVLSVNAFVGGFSPQLADDLTQQPEIAAVTAMRIGYWDLDGREQIATGLDPVTADQTLFLDIQQGDFGALADGGVLVLDTVAEEEGWTLGDEIPMGFARGLQQVEIVGIFAKQNLVQPYVVSLDFFEQNMSGYGSDLDYAVAVKAADGVSPEVSRAVVEAAAADYPNATVRDQAEYRAAQEDQANTMLALFNALLVLAVIIAIFGITNTLALSIYERTHEIGLLRAVGMSRSQVVRAVSWEAIVVAIIGAVLGIVVGTVFGVVVAVAMASQGLTVLSIPVLQIGALVVFGAIAGLIAALFPARRASRLRILDAIAYE